MPFADHPLARAAVAEAEALHVVLEAWLGGAPAPDVFARIEAALAPTFSLVSPDGLRASRAAVIAALQAERGARGPDFRIRVESPEPLAVEPPLIVLAYRERQGRAGAETLRQSMAVFRAEEGAPNGVRWLTLQETWVVG